MARSGDQSRDPQRKVALVYVRVSRFKEEDEGRKVSPQTQVERCAALPALNGLTVEKFEDLDYSGKNTKRPGFEAMMERAQRGDVAVVTCYSLSRLSRSVSDLYGTLQELEKEGVAFVSATEPVDTTTAIGRMFMGILAVLAQFERELLAERVTDGLHTVRAGGKLLGHAPIGYQRTAAGEAVRGQRPPTKLVLDPKAAPVIRDVFRLYSSGRFSVAALADHLNSQKVQAPPNPDYPKNRTAWSVPMLKGLITNVSYTGRVRVDGQLRPGQHPALIDDETFERCQAVRIRNRRRKIAGRYRRHGYALGGLLVCARCGSPMHGRKQYYKCYGLLKKTCEARWVPGEIIEASLRFDLSRCLPDAVKDAAALERVRAGLKKVPNPEQELRRALKALDEREARLQDMFEMGVINTKAELRKRVDRIEEERQDARKRLEAKERTPMEWYEGQVLDLVQAWDSADGAQRGRMLAEIYERIEVERSPRGIVSMVAVPRERWRPFFKEFVQRYGLPGGGKTWTMVVAVPRVNADAQRWSAG